jgi:hypothetical protein
VIELLARRVKSPDLKQFTDSPAMASGVHSPAFSAPVDRMVKGSDEMYPNRSFPLASFLNPPNLRAIYGWKVGDH